MDFIKKLSTHLVFKNFSYLTISNILSQSLNIIIIYKLTSIFSPAQYGIFTFMVIQGQLIMTLGDLGIRNIIIRTISRNNNKINQLFQTGLILKGLSILLFSLIYYTYNYYWGVLSLNQVFFVCILGFISSLNNLLESLFYGLQKMLLPSISNIIYISIWFLVVISWSLSNSQINLLFNIFIAVSFFKTSVLFIILIKKKLIKLAILPIYEISLFPLIKESLPYYFLSLMMLPISYLSNNFLELNSNSTELGYFNFSNKALAPIAMIFTFSFSAIFPNLSSLWISNKNKFLKIASNGIYFFIICSSFLIMIFSFLIKDLIHLFFSESYYPSIPIFQIQIWYVLLMGVNSLIGTIWGASNKEKLLLKTSLINFLISTPALWIGSKYGAFGLSVSYVISFTIFEIYLFKHFLKSLKINSNRMYSPWIITVIIFLLTWILTDFNLLIKSLILILIFFLIFFFRNIIIPKEILNKLKKIQ